jgi:hypothetical protein
MPPLEPTPVRAIAVTAACVAALGLVACGGGDEESTVTTTGAEAAETTTTSEAQTTSTTGSTTTPGDDADVDVDALREQFNEQLRGVLTGQQGLTPSQADCAVEELQDSLTDEALRKVAETGQAPKDLIDAAFDAGVACKDK